MPPRKQTAFRLEVEHMNGLTFVKARDGIPISEQVRRAIDAWLVLKGVKKADRKRAGTRKRRRP